MIPLEHEAKHAMSLVADSTLDSIQVAVGNEFHVTEYGLEVRDGAEPTEDHFKRAIAYLAESGYLLGRMRASLSWALGDLIFLAESRYGHGKAQEIIQEVTSAFGMAKHTLMESYKVAREIRPESRDPALTYTHHQILLQAKKKMTPEEYEELEEFARDGQSVTMQVGDQVVVHQRPKSVQALRERVQELYPTERRPPTPEPPVSTRKPPEERQMRFLYVHREDPEMVFFSCDEIPHNEYLHEDYVVLDLLFREVLDPDKSPLADFNEIE